MYTYQDLLKVGESEKARMDFVLSAISSHKVSEDYETACIANEYDRHRNVTIREYQKILYTVTGKAIPDNYNANFKMACRHFHRIVVQENQFLLGNGVSFADPDVEKILGTAKKPFDSQLQKLGKAALVCGVSFGLYNLDHVDVFSLLDFCPLWDEDDGSLKAGIRFWQISQSKPLRATLYEIDGYTDVIWRNGSDYEILTPKRPYVINAVETKADGLEIRSGENYPGFPIVPFWGNSEHQSELVGLREQIDCYDLIKSGFANTVDEGSFIYWTIQNAGGMDDMDLAKFIERMKTIHAAVVEDDGARAESHQQEVPYASREALLDRLDADLYKDAMALDLNNIASGAATATQIRAAYEPLNSKVDSYEYNVRDFICGILDVAGVESDFSFTRSMIINKSEDINVILSAANYLSADYVTRKILGVLGDGDQAETMLKEMDADELNRFGLAVDSPDA